jgi:hypothetical protein
MLESVGSNEFRKRKTEGDFKFSPMLHQNPHSVSHSHYNKNVSLFSADHCSFTSFSYTNFHFRTFKFLISSVNNELRRIQKEFLPDIGFTISSH